MQREAGRAPGLLPWGEWEPLRPRLPFSQLPATSALPLGSINRVGN